MSKQESLTLKLTDTAVDDAKAIKDRDGDSSFASVTRRALRHLRNNPQIGCDVDEKAFTATS